MKYDEAIKEVKRWTGILMSAGSKCVAETAEAQEMAIEALEKQIPMKPQAVLSSSGKKVYECINCGNELSVNSFDGEYCHWCGQKLDWEENPKE